MSEYHLQEAVSRLRGRAYKLTTPRLAILSYMAAAPGHPDVGEIYRGVSAENPGIGLATVYRTVDLFLTIGILRALTLKGGPIRYELSRSGDHHHHLICTACGLITEFNSCNFGLIAGEIEQETRYRIHDHSLEAYGHCTRCIAAGSRAL